MEMGKAISQKIREAIRAKLIDLGNYVDEELPDYIMVMIANKKTEAQMKDDLVLFLGSNTDKFSAWLQSVLTKLQAARNEQKERKEKAKDKKKKSKKKDDKKDKKRTSSGGDKDKAKGEEGESSVQKDSAGPSNSSAQGGRTEKPESAKANVEATSTSSASKPAPTQEQPEPTKQTVPSSEPVISLLPDTNDFLDEEIKMSESVKKLPADPVKSKTTFKGKEPAPRKFVKAPREEQKKPAPSVLPPASASTHLVKSPPITVTVGARGSRSCEEPVKGSVKSRLGIPAAKRKAVVKEKPREVTTMSMVVRIPQAVPVKRSGPGSVVGQVIQGDEEDSDDEPVVKRVASTIKPRRRPPLPKTKQNSMALLKKAMTQAQESTSVFPAAGQFSEPVRMIVKSASQSGSMKIVARSIPADKETPERVKGAQKKLLTTAVRAASQSVITARPTGSKTTVSVRPLGLMSRSRFKEASERNFDAHEYQRVLDDGKEKDEEEMVQVEKEAEDKEEEEEKVTEIVTEESAEDEEEELEGERQIIEITKAPEKVQIEELSVGMEEGGDEEEQVEDDVEQEVELEMEREVERRVEEEVEVEVEEEVEEKEMEIQEPVSDTRTTKIVRPLQFQRLAELPKRVLSPQPQPLDPSPEAEEVNPCFIVTLEGKKRGPPLHPLLPPQHPQQPPRNLVLSTSRAPPYQPNPIPYQPNPIPYQPNPSPYQPNPSPYQPNPTPYQPNPNPYQPNPILYQPNPSPYQPNPIPSLEANPSLHQSYYDPQEEMEAEVLEEKYFEYEPTHRTQYQQVVLKKKVHRPVSEKETPVGRVLPSEQQVIKEAVFSPPQPRIDPVTFSLHESDEEHGQTEMEEEKINERCKFWPACKNGGECPYVHPSTQCKTFPNCKFGDKCLFIHPNCKFDATCTKPSCPFTHATRTKPAPIIIQAPPIRALPSFKPAQSQTVCKFHPNCSNVRCPFLHPKMCRYNRACTRPDCKFTHSRLAARSAMKWTKEQHISERKFVSKSSNPS